MWLLGSLVPVIIRWRCQRPSGIHRASQLIFKINLKPPKSKRYTIFHKKAFWEVCRLVFGSYVNIYIYKFTYLHSGWYHPQDDFAFDVWYVGVILGYFRGISDEVSNRSPLDNIHLGKLATWKINKNHLFEKGNSCSKSPFLGVQNVDLQRCTLDAGIPW